MYIYIYIYIYIYDVGKIKYIRSVYGENRFSY